MRFLPILPVLVINNQYSLPEQFQGCFAAYRESIRLKKNERGAQQYTGTGKVPL